MSKSKITTLGDMEADDPNIFRTLLNSPEVEGRMNAAYLLRKVQEATLQEQLARENPCNYCRGLGHASEENTEEECGHCSGTGIEPEPDAEPDEDNDEENDVSNIV